MARMTFCIIGAGSAGKAAAAHLSLMGHKVSLFNRTELRIEPLRMRGGIEVEGAVQGFAKLSKITTILKEAVEDADILMVYVPAHAHTDIARMCAPYLRSGHIVILNPGRTFGAIEFANTLKAHNARGFVIAEAQTVLYTCRSNGNGTGCNVIAMKKSVPVASVPSFRIGEVIGPLQGILPQFVPAENVLETSLNNVGYIIHPTPTLLNVGAIERGGEGFNYYHEGITPTVAHILEELDKERLMVAGILGVKAISIRDWLSLAYGAKGRTLHEALHNTAFYRTLKAPSTIEHRYLWEDVPTGLVPIASLGEAFGIKCPVTNQMIDLANLICRTDFRAAGRTLQNIGLGNLSSKELRNAVENGLPD
jgi:opine dehydrogenase